MVDLRTSYLGLELKNPLVASASPISERLDTAKAFERAGASAIVMYSLFEEQIVRESMALSHHLDFGGEAYAEALSYFPQSGRYGVGPETYLDHLRQLKQELDIPVIASLNGATRGRWVEYAERMEASGADALELNLYYLPTDLEESAQAIEDELIGLVGSVRRSVEIPLAVKISPYFTALPHVVQRMAEAGVNGLVLFNRFYQPDFDLDELEVVPNLNLSTSIEMRLPLRWIAILYGRVAVDFALTSGVQHGQDVIKAMMAGAKVTLIASEWLKHGPTRASEMLDEIEAWMVDHEYDSIQQMQGSMCQTAVANPGAFERANYMKVLGSYSYLP